MLGPRGQYTEPKHRSLKDQRLQTANNVKYINMTLGAAGNNPHRRLSTPLKPKKNAEECLSAWHRDRNKCFLTQTPCPGSGHHEVVFTSSQHEQSCWSPSQLQPPCIRNIAWLQWVGIWIELAPHPSDLCLCEWGEMWGGLKNVVPQGTSPIVCVPPCDSIVMLLQLTFVQRLLGGLTWQRVVLDVLQLIVALAMTCVYMISLVKCTHHYMDNVDLDLMLPYNMTVVTMLSYTAAASTRCTVVAALQLAFTTWRVGRSARL